MILGISLNSRIVGMAVLEAESLLDYRIKLFKERWSPEKLKAIVEAICCYMNEFNVHAVALVRPHAHYNTGEVKELLQRIKACCRKRKLKITCYEANCLHQFSGKQRAKKKALMRELSLKFPELNLAHGKELRNKKKYYSKLFEAVGVGLVHVLENY